MKTKPILFSGPMVRAILEGRKVQTRRIVKPQPDTSWMHTVSGDCRSRSGPHDARPYLSNGLWRWGIPGAFVGDWKSPYGQPGDLLWVRESWCHTATADSTVADDIAFKADGEHVVNVDGDGFQIFRADGTEASPWTPSIHMPRCASRLTLRITNIRVERLQDISEEDAEAEGAEPVLVPPDGGSCPHRQGFLELWESINGPGSWDENPWVWVVEFDPIHQNVDCITA